MNFSNPANREILSVSDLNRQVRFLLENEFPTTFVEGEISNFARPGSGHWYFTLKDNKAQLRCAMFRNRNQHIKFKPRDGMQTIVRGRISLYEGRGEYQLIVEEMEESGDGALRRAFEKLKLQLKEEGLFEQETKKPLPALPKHIGIITSPTGAAIRDVLQILDRRFPSIRVSILPVQVQGDDSSNQIVSAIESANAFRQDPIDLLLITRGGGSLEDLWSFNTESVARAIFASGIPTISAVGHETDFTIADYVADLRAPTPSAAAEILSPDQTEWVETFKRYQSLLEDRINLRIKGSGEELNHLALRLRNPLYRLQDYQQRIDSHELRLKRLINQKLQISQLASYQHRFQRAFSQQINQLKLQLSLAKSQLRSPLSRLENLKLNLHQFRSSIATAGRDKIGSQTQQFNLLVQKLNALSPLSTLERGYAIVTLGDSLTQVIKRAEDAGIGDRITARLMQGSIKAEVVESHSDP